MFPLVSLAILGGMPLDPNSSEPPYKQLAALIAGRIHAGQYAPGSALPSGAELAAETGVSRVTVQNALKILKADGLVVGRQGSGVYVRTPGESTAYESVLLRRLATELTTEPIALDVYGRTLDELVQWLAGGAEGWVADRRRVEIRAIVPPIDGQTGVDDASTDTSADDRALAPHATRLVQAGMAGGAEQVQASLVACMTFPDQVFFQPHRLKADDARTNPTPLQAWFEQEWEFAREAVAARMEDDQVLRRDASIDD